MLHEHYAYDYAATIVRSQIFELKNKQADPTSCRLQTGSSTRVRYLTKILAAIYKVRVENSKVYLHSFSSHVRTRVIIFGLTWRFPDKIQLIWPIESVV